MTQGIPDADTNPATAPRFLDLVVQPEIAAESSLALDRLYLRRFGEPVPPSTGLLRIFAWPGETLWLGRYHPTPAPPTDASIEWSRRLSGGRILPMGDGFLGLSLILPHRGALLGQSADSLQAHQVLNRYVRGLLDGLRISGLDPIYPGLDAVTLKRRPFAYLALEEDDSGAILFQAVIAHRRDFAILPYWLDSFDPGGALSSEMVDVDQVTSLRRELGEDLSFRDIAERIRLGYERQFQVATRSIAADLSAAEHLDPPLWDEAMAAPTHQASERTQLGTFTVQLQLDGTRRIADVRFGGDFLASSVTMRTLYARLRGCTCDTGDIDAAVRDVFASPRHFLLGVGQPTNIARILQRAVA